MSTHTAPAPRRWRSRASAVSWTISTAAFVAAGAGLVFVTAVEVERLTRLTAPTPPEVTSDVIVRNAKDRQGRGASFRILLFSDEFRWQLASFEALESDRREPVFTTEMKRVLDSASEIICIGASSEEMPPGLTAVQGRALEERRAARRAERIALWVRQSLSTAVPVRKLNVGHHAPTGDARDTSDQRRVVIVLVLQQDRDADIDEALRDAMARESERSPVFETLLSRYSLATEGKPFTWVE